MQNNCLYKYLFICLFCFHFTFLIMQIVHSYFSVKGQQNINVALPFHTYFCLCKEIVYEHLFQSFYQVKLINVEQKLIILFHFLKDCIFVLLTQHLIPIRFNVCMCQVKTNIRTNCKCCKYFGWKIQQTVNLVLYGIRK